jgi:hypothetical protein
VFKSWRSRRVGVIRGNTGVTKFTVWTCGALFLTPSHTVKESCVKWEFLEGPREKMFLTLTNGL